MRCPAGEVWAPAAEPPSTMAPAIRASPRDRTFMPILLKRGSDRELEGAQLLSLPAIHLDAVVETERAERRQPAHASADVGADALVEVRARRIDVARVVEAGDPKAKRQGHEV